MVEKLQLSGFDVQWVLVLIDWLGGVLKICLLGLDIVFNQFVVWDKQVEMVFYLFIVQLLMVECFDVFICQYDFFFVDMLLLDFCQVCGMLKGFIDLVFCYEGCYYLLDYKFNWLGEDCEVYIWLVMEQVMCVYCYDLQYQLYSLVLYCYLCYWLVDYDYDCYFGGVIYFFLCGMDGQEGGQGIFIIWLV